MAKWSIVISGFDQIGELIGAFSDGMSEMFWNDAMKVTYQEQIKTTPHMLV
jgi:hypothetical protein